MLRNLFVFQRCLPAGVLPAQKKMLAFQLAAPETKAAGSLYNHLKPLDVRDDTTNLGSLFAANYDKKRPVLARSSLPEQFHAFLENSISAAATQTGNLLLRLPRFEFPINLFR